MAHMTGAGGARARGGKRPALWMDPAARGFETETSDGIFRSTQFGLHARNGVRASGDEPGSLGRRRARAI